jgi:cysteine synthase A
LSRQPGNFFTNQFHNEDAIKGYMTLGRELLEQTDGKLTAYCGGVGTAGMIVGVSRALKAAGCAAKIVALEPASSPVLTTGKGGPHRVEGIGAGFRPPHLHEGDYDEVRDIDERTAREMARRLAKEEGIFAGTSSGLNVVAALQLAKELGRGGTVATVAVDSGFKYLAGDLYQG